jgi:SAM-dependent methyltransferase
MIDRAEIDRAFQFCLRRAVGSEEAYAFFEGLGTLDSVYDTLFDSPEFRGRLLPPPQDMAVAPVEVDTVATAAELERMVTHVERTWTRLGDTEPHWSVITEPRFKAASFAANQEIFHDYGRQNEAQLGAALARAGLDAARYRTCFELGCGVGRETVWLAQRFAHVIGADISQPHLNAAQAALSGRDNVELLHIGRLGDLAALPPYDLAYCRIVLQHNPPPVITVILAQMLGGLPPGGAAFFQVPVWIPGYRFRVADYLAGLQTGPMEMHALPQRHLLATVERAGCRVLELREDALGPQFGGISNTLLVEKCG